MIKMSQVKVPVQSLLKVLPLQSARTGIITDAEERLVIQAAAKLLGIKADGVRNFVIKKKSGKWRLLHDLHAVNAQMETMGSVQLGLLMTSALLKNWTSIVRDLKDCFFTIPLHPAGTDKFAFTLPSINHSAPDLRYECVVLP